MLRSRFKCYPLLAVGAVFLMVACSWVLYLGHDKICFHDQTLGIPLALDVSLLAAAFIVCGNLWIYDIAPKVWKMKGCLPMLLGGTFLLLSLFGAAGKNRNGYPQMATYDIGNPFFYAVIAVACSIGIIIFANILAESKWVQKCGILKGLSWFGSNSMLIFIVHRTLLYELKNYYEVHPRLVVCIFAWIILIVYSGVLAMAIGRICPVLAGKYKGVALTVRGTGGE